MKSYMWTVKDVSELFGISKWVVYKLVERKELQNDSLTGKILFNPSQIKRFINKFYDKYPCINGNYIEKLTKDYIDELDCKKTGDTPIPKQAIQELKNNEHYTDPTPYKAIKNIEKKSYPPEVGKLMNTIFYICGLAGYNVKGRVTLVDRKTGKEYN